MKKVFITGATGFVGGHLKRHLTEAGYQVFSATRDELCDPFSAESWRKTLERAECKQSSTLSRKRMPPMLLIYLLLLHRRVNVDTKALLQASQDVGIKVRLSQLHQGGGEETPRDTPLRRRASAARTTTASPNGRPKTVLEYTNMNTIILPPLFTDRE